MRRRTGRGQLRWNAATGLRLTNTLRHTCATELFKGGLNAKQVQVWLGHHSPAFTLATYVHLLPEDLPDADFLDSLYPAEGVNAASTRTPETGRDSAGGGAHEDVALAGIS
jgi:integrase-like protein